MIKERADMALAVHGQLLSQCIKNEKSFYNAIMELIGVVTTLGEKQTRSPFLTDGVYADVLANPGISDLWFQLLLDEARPVAVELGFNRCGAKCRDSPRYSALKDAYDECIEASLARRMVIASATDKGVSFPEGAEFVGSFLKRRSVFDGVATEPSSVDKFDFSSLEPVKVHC